jgi:hypothetical protein
VRHLLLALLSRAAELPCNVSYLPLVRIRSVRAREVRDERSLGSRPNGP